MLINNYSGIFVSAVRLLTRNKSSLNFLKEKNDFGERAFSPFAFYLCHWLFWGIPPVAWQWHLSVWCTWYLH